MQQYETVAGGGGAIAAGLSDCARVRGFAGSRVRGFAGARVVGRWLCMAIFAGAKGFYRVGLRVRM